MNTLITSYASALAALNTLTDPSLRGVALANLALSSAIRDPLLGIAEEGSVPAFVRETLENMRSPLGSSLWAQPDGRSFIERTGPSHTLQMAGSEGDALISGADSESFIHKHLAAHLDDKPSLASKVDVEKFGGVDSLIEFAQGRLEKAYRGELEPGAEVDVVVEREGRKPLKGRLRLMKTGETIDGAPVGESGPGKLSILQITFDEPVGENSVVALEDLPAGTPTLMVQRNVGGRQDTVKVVSGEHEASNQLMIIGGPYAPGSFGLYTVYAGRYTRGYDPKDPESMAYWAKHAYLTGDSEVLVEERHRGEVVNPDSNLFEMIRNGEVAVPQGALSRVRRGESFTAGRSVEEGGEGVLITALRPDFPVVLKPGTDFAEFTGAKVHGIDEEVEVNFKLQDGTEETYLLDINWANEMGFVEYDGKEVRPVPSSKAPEGIILIEKRKPKPLSEEAARLDELKRRLGELDRELEEHPPEESGYQFYGLGGGPGNSWRWKAHEERAKIRREIDELEKESG